MLTGFAPYLLREGDEFLPARTDDRARASQGLEFPELCPTMIVAAIRINRSHERTLLAFGPQPRSYDYQFPKKKLLGALRSALASKFADGKLIVVNAFDVKEPKTKEFRKALDLSPEDLSAARWPLARQPHRLETSLPAVFAVGDVRGGNIKRVASAVGEGSIAVAFVHQVLRE